MSYNKLGFEKGQVLKAEHLNHMEEGIAAACTGGSDNKVIILNAQSDRDPFNPANFLYNGEALDGNFVLDCLMSGYQFIIEFDGLLFGMREWEKESNKVKITVAHGSLCPVYTLSV